MAQDILQDGFVGLCLSTDLNFFDGKCRVLVEGQYVPPVLPATVVTPDALRAVTTVRDVDALFGAGSQLSEALKVMFCACPSNVEFFVIPRPDPVAAVAAKYTLTFTGPATSPGRVEVFMVDTKYNFSIPVEAGDTAAAIAAAVAAEISSTFPFTATAAAGVVTLTAKNKGVIGNTINSVYNWRGLENYAPSGVAMVQAQTVVGTGAPLPLNYESILGECCYCCFANLIPANANIQAWIEYVRTKWSCDRPMCFGHSYHYSQGTKGQILASFTNGAEGSIVAQSNLDKNPGWMKVANYTALSCCTATANPEISIQGPAYGLLSCIGAPESCSTPWTYEELQEIQAKGYVVTLPASSGSGQITSPYIVNDITNYLYDDKGRPNITYRDTNSRRLEAQIALQTATELKSFQGLALFTRNTSIKAGVQGTNPRLMLASIRAWAKSKVGILFSAFDDIDKQVRILTDEQIKPACQGDPGIVHLFFRYRRPARIQKIVANLEPQLIGNCNR